MTYERLQILLGDSWDILSPTSAAVFEKELALELGPKHFLFGEEIRALAVRNENDDLLCAFPKYEDRLAVVHLTWRGKQEEDPVWPGVTFYGSEAAFIAFEEDYQRQA